MSKKFYKTDEDAPANATGTSVAGTGDDSSVVKKKKKQRFSLFNNLVISRPRLLI